MNPNEKTTPKKSQSKPVTKADLNMTFSKRGVWLVKVPKYIANKWEKAHGMEVANLKVVKGPNGKSDLSLTLPDSVLALKEPGEEEVIPKTYKLELGGVAKQKLGIFSEPLRPPGPGTASSSKFNFEGAVIEKAECRPIADDTYMQLKLNTIKKASIPSRQVKQLDKIVQNFKPVANHKHNIEFEKKKKAEGKKVRASKELVMEKLFAAFEKHQYYNIKDLVTKTGQPITYLKEILREVCNHNLKAPHKNMWELKPEYTHYKGNADLPFEQPTSSTAED